MSSPFVTGTQVKNIIANRTIETVEQLEYLGTAITNQTYIHNEKQRRSNSGNLGLTTSGTSSTLSYRNNLNT
jgi:hypothetical protein